MKKTVLILGIVMSFFFLNAQDTNKVSYEPNKDININININLDEVMRSIEETNIKLQELIAEKEVEIEKLNNEIYVYTTKPDGEDVYVKQIDSLDNLVEINQGIIEELNDAMEELAEEMEELSLEMEDLQEELNTDFQFTDENCDDDKKSNKFKGHWAGMQLGLNTYLDNTNSLNLPMEYDFMNTQLNKSWQFDINPVQFSIPFFNRYVGAVTGIGFSFNNYELLQNVLLNVNSDGNLSYVNSTYSYTKNRFKTSSLTVPLIIEFQIPVNDKDKRFFIGAGAIGSMNLSTRMKTSYVDGNNVVSYTDRTSNWPINLFTYQATLRLGYDDWYIFANYSMMPLFENNKGPEIYPVSAGLAFRF